MGNTIDKVDELTAELNSLQSISPENSKKLEQKFRLEFNYNSNHLEGNTLTYSETQLLLLFDDTQGNHSMREYEEMKAHDVAFQMVEEWARDKKQPLTEHSIKNLNKIIQVRPFWKSAITPDMQKTRRLIKVGNYKEHPNSVRLANGEIFEYASPDETPILMGELIEWYRSEENQLHPVTLAAMLHYKFVRIHPFDDGNGRISRLLMNYVLLKNDLPPIIIKSKEKDNYLRALHQADIGNYEPFISYIAEQLIWSLEVSIKATKGENIDEDDDLDKKLALLKQEVEAEDNENDIQTRLTAGAIYTALNDWGYYFLTELAFTTSKFNQFFHKSNHYIGLTMNSTGQNIPFEKKVFFEKFESLFEKFEKNESLQRADLNFRCNLSAYKKGGLNTFGCNYSIEIKFEEYHYEVFVGYFEGDDPKNKMKSFTKRLLHKPLLPEEIKDINKQWGETLYNHLEYYRRRQNGNNKI